MDEIREVLREQAKKYPLMECQDFLKLIYQNEMAGGHMIKDIPSALSFLQEEAAAVQPALCSFDDIGNDIARVYLSDVLARNIPLNWLNDAFTHTANKKKGDTEVLKEKLSVFYEEVRAGNIGLDTENTKKVLAAYREKGFPPIHHSERFRDNYHPHYRVVYKRFADLLPVLEKANLLRAKKDRTVIVIDGRCGSGKSTLSHFLREILKCPVVHVDDFFLPPEKRTEERLAEAGGNVNYEYFKETVVDALNSGENIKYKPFDCHSMTFKEEISMEKSDFLIIEGSYSFHPFFGAYGDIRVFSDIGTALQRERIINRNQSFAQNFFTRWIPMEEKYFDTFDVRNKADIIIKAER